MPVMDIFLGPVRVFLHNCFIIFYKLDSKLNKTLLKTGFGLIRKQDKNNSTETNSYVSPIMDAFHKHTQMVCRFTSVFLDHLYSSTGS